VPLIWLPCDPGTPKYFVAHASLWGLAGLFLLLQRKLSWEAAGFPDGPPVMPNWPREFPCWAYDMSFWIQVLNVPALLLLCYRFGPTWTAWKNAASQSLSDMPLDVRYGTDMSFEYIVLASNVGFQLKDAYLWVALGKMDVRFIGHHAMVVVIMVSVYFCPTIVGMRMIALLTTVVESGSAAYCAWALWGMRKLYIFAMSLSNVLFLIVSSVLFKFQFGEDGSRDPGVAYVLYACCLALIFGRQAACGMEVRDKALCAIHSSAERFRAAAQEAVEHSAESIRAARDKAAEAVEHSAESIRAARDKAAEAVDEVCNTWEHSANEAVESIRAAGAKAQEAVEQSAESLRAAGAAAAEALEESRASMRRMRSRSAERMQHASDSLCERAGFEFRALARTAEQEWTRRSAKSRSASSPDLRAGSSS
jgi:hypothetical protein